MNWRNVLQSKNLVPTKLPPIPPSQTENYHNVSFLREVERIEGRIRGIEKSKETALKEVPRPKTNTLPAPFSPKQWIADNQITLKEAGFTDKDLYGHRWITGVSEFLLWERPGITVKLVGDVLCFTWKNATGERITQTCRPERTTRE